MGMGPGLGFRMGGFKYTIPVNEYGEMESEGFNPGMMLQKNLTQPYRNRMLWGGLLRSPEPGAMSGNNKAWNASVKKLGQGIALSKDSKRYRQDMKNIERELELKKLNGVPIDERDMRKYWAAKDNLETLQASMDHFYGGPERNKALSKSLNYGKRSDTYHGSSKQFKTGRK